MDNITYKQTGVDISHTDDIKREMSSFLETDNPRVLNRLGPFASLYDIRFDDIENPVLVLKSEEPGSKQKLAVTGGYTESVCHDMINHLVNDIIVMGARPLAVLDTIVCGSAGKDTITAIIKGISEACRANGCDLVGGETSVQPGVVDDGTYILTASVAGIVDRANIIDGSAIKPGDKLIALASNGLHTNGYTLVRHMLDVMPGLRDEIIGTETFFEAIMKPHTSYYKAVKGVFGNSGIHGMAHITGGGIEGNLSRILPANAKACIDLGQIEVPPVFRHIKAKANIADDEMLKTFNCGAGLIIAVSAQAINDVINTLSQHHRCFLIGEIAEGGRSVEFYNQLRW